MGWNAFSLYWFAMFPAAMLCAQYGWDMIIEELIPVKEVD